MKSNKVLIIIGILLLNVLVAYTVGQSFLGKTTKYDDALAEARALAEADLCSRSIEKYEEVRVLKDSLALRLEMLDVYEKGIDSGELTSTYEIFRSVSEMVEAYRKDPAAYEEACAFLMKYEEYEDCAELLMRARETKITSEKIEEFRKQVRYKNTHYYAMYTDVQPSYDDAFRVVSDGYYTYLSGDASPISGVYSYASSFCNGYAFVKQVHPDGRERGFLINRDEQRQIYLDDVAECSGAGVAKNAEGDAISLLACKVGETYKYYTLSGEVAFGEYAFAGRFRNNVAAVMESEGKWKLIDGTGTPIVDKTFSDVVLNEFDECAPKGLIFAKDGEKYHIYDLQGAQISDFACDGAKAFVDEYAAFRQGDRWGYVDTRGSVIIEPEYDDAKSFSNRLGAVLTGDVWQLISPDKEIALDETYEDVGYLNENGVLFVKNDGYWSYLKMYYIGE